MTLALARSPALRAMTGAPLTLADVPVIACQVMALLAGKEPPALPKLAEGTGQPTAAADAPTKLPEWWVGEKG